MLRGLFFLLILPSWMFAVVNVGVGRVDITPPIGTPSAGYTERKGEGMVGVHDSLLALALLIDNGEKKIALCSVDHLGFTYEMVQEITERVHQHPGLADCEVYIGSSHTHSGGGSYLNIPVLGEMLAGPYSPEITNQYIEKTVQAILAASEAQVPAKIGIGYGNVAGLSKYRGLWPKDVIPVTDVAVIKVTHLDGRPLAILFNYAVHPTVLKSQNRLFSADFVGYARDHLQALLGDSLQPIYFNGAQGDIIPAMESCDEMGKALARAVETIWKETEVSEDLHIQTQKESYSFKPQATPFGVALPVELYQSEMNVVVFNHVHAFLTIPGELSSLYDQKIKERGKELGYSHVSIWGLTNDAHGYIILPESWRHKTFESALSFGGEFYGEITEKRAATLLQQNNPSLK